jgi:hypothetical protein
MTCASAPGVRPANKLRLLGSREVAPAAPGKSGSKARPLSGSAVDLAGFWRIRTAASAINCNRNSDGHQRAFHGLLPACGSCGVVAAGQSLAGSILRAYYGCILQASISGGGNFMSYMITGTDSAGALSLKRDSAAAAIKKAVGLMGDGCRDVCVTCPDGRFYSHPDFDQLRTTERA